MLFVLFGLVNPSSQAGILFNHKSHKKCSKANYSEVSALRNSVINTVDQKGHIMFDVASVTTKETDKIKDIADSIHRYNSNPCANTVFSIDIASGCCSTGSSKANVRVANGRSDSVRNLFNAKGVNVHSATILPPHKKFVNDSQKHPAAENRQVFITLHEEKK